MSEQAEAWSKIAAEYEREFVDPDRPGATNPVRRWLERRPADPRGAAADLGCGTGVLLPLLAERFAHVHAVDFAEAMLSRARERCRGLAHVTFHLNSLADLSPWHGQVDVAVAVNSLVMPDVREADRALAEVYRCLRPGGRFLGIVPAMDSVHYCTTIYLERALRMGLPMDVARQNAAHHNDHHCYDFAFGQFRFRGIEQHFWHPEELRFRLGRAGFGRIQLRKARLAWSEFVFHRDLALYPAPWDWAFMACKR